MAVTQRGPNSFQVSINHNGRRYRKSFSSPQEAHTAERRAIALLELGAPPFSAVKPGDPSRMTVGQARRIALEVQWAGSKGERTAEINSRDVCDYFGPDTPVSEIDQAVLNGFLGHLKSRKLSPSTINKKFAALSVMLRLAKEAGANVEDVKLPRQKEGPGRTRFLTVQEWCRLRDLLVHEALATFMLFTGARYSEAVGVRWQDLVDGKVLFRDTKSGKHRSVPLAEPVRHLVHRDLYIYGVGPFTGTVYEDFLKDFKSGCVSAGLGPDVVPHTLRHTCASWLVQGGTDILTVQKWLGHSTIEQTMRYAHLAPDHLEVGRKSLEKMLGSGEDLA